MITITPEACKHALDLKEKLNKTENDVLNIKLDAGGCSGFMYSIEFIPRPSSKTHKIFENEDLIISCDKKSYIFLIGTEIIWEESLMSTGFKFNTPQATAACGCGESVAF